MSFFSSKEFVVYSTNTGTATARPILRWGKARSTASAEAQAGVNEAVRIVDAVPQPTSVYGRFTINTSTWAVSAEIVPGAPGGDPRTPEQIEDWKNSRKGAIRMLLRESEWSQLPDAPLTTARVAVWAAYRAALRDMYTGSCAIGADNCEVGFPTKPSDPEFDAEFD